MRPKLRIVGKLLLKHDDVRNAQCTTMSEAETQRRQLPHEHSPYTYNIHIDDATPPFPYSVIGRFNIGIVLFNGNSQ